MEIPRRGKMAEMGRPRESRAIRTPLRRWLSLAFPDASTRPTPADLAKRLGTSRSHMYALLDGARMPSLELGAAIERVTGGAVRAIDWVRRRNGR